MAPVSEAGSVIGSLPAGSASPKRMDAQALPVTSPPRKRQAKAETSPRQGVSMAPGASMRTMTGLPCLASAAMSSSAPSSSASVVRSWLSVVVEPATTTTASAWSAMRSSRSTAFESSFASALDFSAAFASGVSTSRLSSALASALAFLLSLGSGSSLPSSRTVMPERAARSLMPCRGVTTWGAATWPEPPPEYVLPGPQVFISSRALAAGPRTASVLTRAPSSGSTPSFFRSTTLPVAASSASLRCASVLTFNLRSSSQGSAQPGFSSSLKWKIEARTRRAASLTEACLTSSNSPFLKFFASGCSMSRPFSTSLVLCAAPQSDITKPAKPILCFRSRRSSLSLEQAQVPFTLLYEHMKAPAPARIAASNGG
mmetsp:Transcript_32226/g.92752  ORF Transcript_32226/g.92752 Transcript_32226/m.92752 type:complete len:372 (+) Transcript_32226:502-1617(+)